MRSLLTVMLLATASAAKSSDYLVYHDLINRAEYHIVNKNADSGLLYYDKAFAEFDYVFPKDALIAAQFAWKSGNKNKTVAYLVKGSKSGLRSTCINDCPILASFMKDASFEAVYDSMRAGNRRYKTKVDVPLAEEWQQRYGSMLMVQDLGDFISIVQENMVRIKELLKSGKYPGERLLGQVNECKTQGNNDAYYTMINYECVVSELNKELWQAVKNGELHPREFGRLCDWEYLRTKRSIEWVSQEVKDAIAGKLTTYGLKDNEYVTINRDCDLKKQQLRRFNLVFSYIGDTTPQEINKQRAAYYITSLEVDEKKKQLEQSERYVFFFGMH